MKSRIVPRLPRCSPLILCLRPRRRRNRSPKPPQKIDEEYTQDHQAEPAGSAHHDRARRSPAGVRHGALAAEVPRPRRRHAGRADLREGHLSLLRGAREGGAARAKYWKIGTTEEGRDIVAARDRRRGHDQVARQVPRHARRADRSAQDHRGAARSSCCTPPSRSTTRSAACTRRRPAVPRC